MSSNAIKLAAVQVEHHESGFGIGTPTPRISWRFEATTAQGWFQTDYEIVIAKGDDGKEEKYSASSDQSVLVKWPSSPLKSRERATIRVRAKGKGEWTDAASLTIEAGLLDKSDWAGKLISTPAKDIDKPKPPFRLRKTFKSGTGTARIYATALGLYEITLNGKVVGDQVLAPGWQSYKHHLNYQVYDVSSLLRGDGDNELVVEVGEGWYAGRLGRPGTRNVWGERLGFLGQLEVDGKVVVSSDETWEVTKSRITNSEIYNGESFDSTLDASTSSGKAEVLPSPQAQLISSDAPPVRRIKEVKPIELITTPSGKKVIDFGQNLVGWIRLENNLKGENLVIRHAEVLEHGELGTRPLRTAQATTKVKLGGDVKGWEPKFTFYGFRYIEVTGVEVKLSDYSAIVIASDLRRTGTFDCSHTQITQLHKNVVWGMLGNFVSVPTDCPQRDERLGWTGDIQVFAPTANFLFDTSGFLAGWLRDLDAETKQYGGVVPEVVPYIPLHDGNPRAHAAWGDVSAMTPWDLYTAFGDVGILEKQFESMALWIRKGIKKLDNGLWEPTDKQYGDWLDPKAPPGFPAHGATDPFLVANAYLVHVTRLVADTAKLIGKTTEAASIEAEYQKIFKAFHEEYVSPAGRLVSDTQTALALALHFGILQDERQRKNAADRLDWLIRWDSFKVSTGFAGTPIILDTLAEVGKLNLAYRMLQSRDNPSWLYPVTMGATTIWERWDSMLPDGTINPGQMTSFNHYALGSVANFLHSVVGGLSPLEPGWKKALIKPRPGGTITSAKVSFDSAYGPYAVEWELKGGKQLKVKASVPPNGQAEVELPGVKEVVGSGEHQWEVEWVADGEWPPKQLKGPTRDAMPDNIVE